MKSSSKATHGELRRHNLQLLLRAVYSGQADNRAALAQHSGLAKPTVSELVGELLRLGLLAEEGTGQSTESGGKRPRLLRFVPNARQIIGVTIETHQIAAVLATLDGQILARHSTALDGARGQDAVTLLCDAINGLVAQLDAPLLCLGVGVPGAVDEALGVVKESSLLGWNQLSLAATLSDFYGVPAYVANSTELAAMAQRASTGNGEARTLVTILIDHNIEVGVVFANSETHFGSDIGCLQIALPGGSSQALEALLTLPALRHRATELAVETGNAGDTGSLTYLGLRRHLLHHETVARELYDEAARHIAQVCVWVIALIRPDQIALAGPIVAMGEPLLQRVVAATHVLFPSSDVDAVTFTLTGSEDLSAVGAVTYALQQELGIGS